MRLAAVTGLVLAAPAIAGAAAAAEGHSRFGPTLFALALLVGGAKAGGLAAERFRQPAVLGELIVGISVSALAHVFVGAALSATSVGITARVLKDLGVTQTREAQIILGAAVLDDILGLIVLAAVTAIATAGAAGLAPWTVAGILVRAVLFLGATAVAGHFLSSRIIRLAARTNRPETILVIGLALCFSLAYAAELIGLADIIGAFAAGLLLDPYGRGVRPGQEAATLAELIHPLSSLFVPLFFVLMGIQVHVGSVGTLSAFAVVLTLGALVGKAACAPRRRDRHEPAGDRDRDDSPRRGRADLRGHRQLAHRRRSAAPAPEPLLRDRRDGPGHDAGHAARAAVGVRAAGGEGPWLADPSSPSRFPPTRLIRRQDVRRPTACRGASPPQAPYHRRPVPPTPPSHLSFPAPPTRRPRLAGMLPIFREARREPR